MKVVRCFWRTDRTCPHPPLCRYGYDCVARPKERSPMKRTIARLAALALLTLTLTLGLGHALAPGYHTAGELEWCEHCP